MIEEFQNLIRDAREPLLVSMAAVAVFAYGRFKTHDSGLDEYDPPLGSESFTTPYRYSTAVFLYIFFYWLLFLGLLVFWQTTLGQAMISQIIPGTGAVDATTGSPAWAAAITTSVLPPLPFVSSLDEAVRTRLHHLARIPLGARRLGRKIREAIAFEDVDQLKVRMGERTINIEDAFEYPLTQFLVLKDLRNGLAKDVNKTPRFAQYNRFFNGTSDFEDRVTKRFWETLGQERSTPYLVEEANNCVRAMSRIISCATLTIERSESAAATLVRNLGVGVYVTGWNFRMTHAALIFLGSMTFTFAASMVAYAMVSDDPSTSDKATVFMFWGVSAAFMYLASFVFAAGIGLIVSDAEEDLETAVMRQPDAKRTLDLHEWTLALLFAFAGATLLADLVIVAFSSLDDSNASPSSAELLIWGMCPAAVSVVFIILSRIKSWTGPRYRLVDACLLSATALTTTFLAIEVLVGDAEYANLTNAEFRTAALTSSGVLGAFLGILLPGSIRDAAEGVKRPEHRNRQHALGERSNFQHTDGQDVLTLSGHHFDDSDDDTARPVQGQDSPPENR